ncbi:MAG: hypothetical protein MH472_04245 [Bacteroidia bacterium]|nr:hypothetical protein [Bacteroidia bacterium]
MALNQNHTAEELGGYRCAIVEKNISEERARFLTELLSGNGYTVVQAPAAAPKAKAAAKAPAEGSEESAPAEPIATEPKYDLGVTDLLFNPINAIYGRLLKTKSGHTVSLKYWQQQAEDAEDDKPYFL